MGYTQDLVAHWDLSTDDPPDLCWRGNRYPGTGANLVGHPNGVAGGICTEFDGDDSNVNCGDVIELNSASAFSVAFWMKQNVLDVQDVLFTKYLDATHAIMLQTAAAGFLQMSIRNGSTQYGQFDYSTAIAAKEWAHIVIVFDGSLVNANRIAIYVDGTSYALAVSASIPTVTADMSGVDVIIGNYGPSLTLALDGKLDEFMIFGAALTNLQAADLYARTRQGRF